MVQEDEALRRQTGASGVHSEGVITASSTGLQPASLLRHGPDRSGTASIIWAS